MVGTDKRIYKIAFSTRDSFCLSEMFGEIQFIKVGITLSITLEVVVTWFWKVDFLEEVFSSEVVEETSSVSIVRCIFQNYF